MRLSNELRIQGLQAVTETLPPPLQEYVKQELKEDPSFKALLALIEDRGRDAPVNKKYAQALVSAWKKTARRIINDRKKT